MSSISIDLAKEILDEVLKRGAKFAIVRLEERTYERIVYDTGMLREYSYSTLRGAGIRVCISEGCGYAYTTDISRDAISRAIDKAFAIARTRAVLVSFDIGRDKLAKGRFVTVYKVNPFDVDSETKVRIVERIDRESRGREGVVSTATMMAFERDRRIVVSSDGAEAEADIMLVGYGHLAVARSGDVMERVYDSKSFVGGFEYINEQEFAKLVEEVDRLAVEASKAKTPSPGVYRAVIDNDLVGLLIHEAFGHASEGDEVVAKASVLEGRIGGTVASELVTVIDDGSIEGGYPVPFDDEGVVKTRTIVVDRGVLKSYLTSRATARRLGLEPTGNARAESILFEPLVRQTNYFIAPGDWKVDEMLRDMKEGLYLRGRGAMGGQVDPATGTFTFSIGPSYIVKNGEPVELVRGVTVSGQILEILRDVDAIGRDLKVETSVFGFCGKGGQHVRVGDGGPHIRVKRITVGGGI